MTRFSGQALPAHSRIAVVANDAIGNFVAVTPLLRMLRDALHPAAIDYYGGSRTWDLQTAGTLADWTYPLWGTPPWQAAAELLRRKSERPYDLVVNVESSSASKCYASIAAGEGGLVCGPCLAEDGRRDLPFAPDERGKLWEDPNWIAEDIVERYSFLGSGFIGELFCRLCYLDGPIPPYQITGKEPPIEVPEMLVSTAASLPEKLWPLQGWTEALRWARARGLTVGLLGAKREAQKEFWQGCSVEDELVALGWVEDLRGTMSLPEVAGALARTRLVLTIDNGILHLAAAAGAETVGLFRHGYHRLWAPRASKLRVLTSGRLGPVSEIRSSYVLEALESAL